ncbi:MAG: hypothetical protein RLN76_06205 [Phycisphaeraceae bacterium]
MRRRLLLLGAVLGLVLPAAAAWADGLQQRVDRAIERGLTALVERQGEDGSWTAEPGPAVTALVLEGLYAEPGFGVSHPAGERGLAYVLSFVKEDGGIHGGFLQNYNTAICLAALASVADREGVAEIIKGGHDFLRGLQWAGQVDPRGEVVTEVHPYYGGAGYGGKGRPDLSNTATMLAGLHASGLDAEDEAYQRAVVFLTRVQAVPENDLFDAEVLPRDGGFIYATSVNLDLIGVPESKANPEKIDEALAGQPVSGLRGYGSMTYAGFMSYLYAELDRDDPRVRAAYRWLGEHYTVERNPGMPAGYELDGLFYYYLVMARSLSAWGEMTIDAPEGERKWAVDLSEQLLAMQGEDGLWRNESTRWLEGDPNLATAYAVQALQAARPWLDGDDE